MSTVFFLAAGLSVGTPVTIDDALLADLPIAQASLTAHGKTQRCEGPLLRELLASMGALRGDAISGSSVARGVLVTARDGYRVLFSLGEIDATLGASNVIVATRCDGKALDQESGPIRLVVPGEQRAARSVRQVATMELVEVSPQAR